MRIIGEILESGYHCWSSGPNDSHLFQMRNILTHTKVAPNFIQLQDQIKVQISSSKSDLGAKEVPRVWFKYNSLIIVPLSLCTCELKRQVICTQNAHIQWWDMHMITAVDLSIQREMLETLVHSSSEIKLDKCWKLLD